jgi:hypothetical protein
MSYQRAELGVSSVAFNVTPNNTANIGNPRMLYVGTTGDLNVTLENSTGATILRNFPAGAFLFASVRLVSATGTTASNIVAFR